MRLFIQNIIRNVFSLVSDRTPLFLSQRSLAFPAFLCSCCFVFWFWHRERRLKHIISTFHLTFVHSNATVVTLDDLVGVLAVVSQTHAADEDVLSVPGLGAVQQCILGVGEQNRSKATYQCTIAPL